MKRNLALVLLCCCLNSLLYATEQEKDTICINEEKLLLDQSRYISILKDYFITNNNYYPFTSNSTSNYRGYIANWEIKDSMLYLKSLHYDEYNIKEFIKKNDIDPHLPTLNNIINYSGILLAKSTIDNSFFLVRIMDGKMLELKKYKSLTAIKREEDQISQDYKCLSAVISEIKNGSKLGNNDFLQVPNSSPLYSMIKQNNLYEIIYKNNVERVYTR